MRRSFCSLVSLLFVGGCFGGTPAPYVHYGEKVPHQKSYAGMKSDGMYSVLDGDTLWKISRQYKISMRDLVEVNGLSSPYRLKSGQRLRIPAPKVYDIVKGDNLYRVSRMFSVDMYQLARANDLKKPYVLNRGDRLVIPRLDTRRRKKAEVQVASVDRHDASLPRARPARKGGKKSKMARSSSGRIPSRSSSTFLWPIDGGRVVSTYGPKSGGLRNDGVNIGAARNAKVRAAENGVVAYVGDALEGFGQLILIKHSDRWVTAYAHLGGAEVRKGDVVKRGDLIGRVGSSGNVATPQLHFETRRGTRALNPQKYSS